MQGNDFDEVLKYFYEISSYPHGSGNVDKVSDMLVRFAKERNLEVRVDEYKNVFIKKSATAGYEDRPVVMIQGHIDMVAVKSSDCNKDLKNEGLDLARCVIDGKEYLYAKGTSLGADDGIAVAYAMALLDLDSIPHPALECVFTVDEEVGMDGAIGANLSDSNAKWLLNIDSEEEGVITTSCAGGVRVHGIKRIKRNGPMFGNLYSVTLKNLSGGHSGTMIHLGRANACKELGKVLKDIADRGYMFLSEINGGEADNVIPNGAQACFFSELDKIKVDIICAKQLERIKREYGDKEKNVELYADFVPLALPFSPEESIDLINIISETPDGVVKMCEHIDMVETSLNLGVIKTGEEAVELDFCLRSSDENSKNKLKVEVCSILEKYGCEVSCSGEYPGWKYAAESELRDKAAYAYNRLFGKQPVIEGVHAGLECGILISKRPQLDAISIGPDILNIHTVNEKLDLASAQRTWELVKEILK